MSEEERRSWELSTAFYNAQFHYQSYQWWWNAYLQLLQLQSEPNEQPCECSERPYYANVDSTCLNCRECPVNSPPLMHNRLTQVTEVSEAVAPNFSKAGTKEYSSNTTANNLYVGQEKNYTLDQFEGDCDEGEDDEDFEMEVDEQFVKFLEQSKQHREERDRMRRKQKEDEENDDYIEVGSVKLNTTTLPPSEKPGLRRVKEMKKLYGQDSSRIQQLETNLQLRYDKRCDARQPVYWPSIPLKF